MDAVVLTLAKARTELGTNTLERHIAHALSLPAFNVSALIDGEDYATIVVYGRSSELDADDVAAKINAAIQRNEAAA